MPVKSVSIRIEEAMLKKIACIADYEGRSINSHILVLVRENIRRFEEAHGEIAGEILPDENVKPAERTDFFTYVSCDIASVRSVHDAYA